MNIEQLTGEEGQLARRYEYEDATVLAVDFGTEAGDASVDCVDGTVIVVASAERRSADRSNGDEPLEDDEQYEFELPDGAGDANTFIKNGVLTVEMEADL